MLPRKKKNNNNKLFFENVNIHKCEHLDLALPNERLKLRNPICNTNKKKGTESCVQSVEGWVQSLYPSNWATCILHYRYLR